MKILVYGNYWDGTHSDSISRSLDYLKLNNKVFDPYKFKTYNTNFIILNKVLRRVFLLENRKIINEQLLIKVNKFKPDILLISKGLDIYPETLFSIKKLGIYIINWNPDDFFNMLNSNKNLINSIPIYDKVYSSRPHLFEEYYKRGFNELEYLEWYYLPWFHKYNSSIEEKKDFITFIGTYSKNREQLIRMINKEHKIVIWGDGWEKSKIHKMSNVECNYSNLNQEDFPLVINQSRINLNILTKENRDLTNLKIFEISACGGILLTNDNNQSKSILGSNAFYYDNENINSVINNINYIMKDISIKTFKEKVSSRIIRNNNSIIDRVKQIITKL